MTRKGFFVIFIIITSTLHSQNIFEDTFNRYYKISLTALQKTLNNKPILRVDGSMDSTRHYYVVYKEQGFDSIWLFFFKSKFSSIRYFVNDTSLFNEYYSYCTKNYYQSNKNRFTIRKRPAKILFIRKDPNEKKEEYYEIRIIDSKHYPRI